MPWRRRAQVLGAVAAFGAAVAGEWLLIRHGWRVSGAAAFALTVAVSLLVLQAYWVRFDLPSPLGAWRATVSSSSGTGARAVLGDNSIALTFDDGPGPDTVAVLDALDRANVRATFFVLGTAARARPDLVREIARRGHVVGIHGDTHRKLHLALPGTIAREIDRAMDAVRAAGIEPHPLFRAPHGFKGPLLASALRARGLRLVGWTRGMWDSDVPGASVIAERATRDMRGGEILLLHDGAPANDGRGRAYARREGTAAAIEEIVTTCTRAGFKFVTLEPLYARRTRGADSPGGAAPDDNRPPDIASGARATGASAMRKLRRPTALVRVILLVVAGVLVARALRHFDSDELLRAIRAARIPFLVAAAFANVLALAMQAARWLAVLHPIEPRARPRDAFFALVAGYAIGLVVPARASDLARAHLMARRTGASMATLTATAVVDHLLGSIALLAAIGLGAAVWPLPAWLRRAGAFAAAGAAAVLVALWLLRPKTVPAPGLHATTSSDTGPLPVPGDHATASPPTVPGKASRSVASTGRGDPLERFGSIGRVLARLRAGLVAVGSPRALVFAGLFAAAGWASEGLIAHWSLRAFGLPAGAAPSMVAVVATTLSAAASISPGNAGAFEVACVVALAGFGVPQEPALAFAIGYHCVHVLPTAVLGGGWLIVSGFRPAALRGAT